MASGSRWIIVAMAATALAGCGHRFPVLERATPITYGPPFGNERDYIREQGQGERAREPRRNVLRARNNAGGHHPANPAGEERSAEFLGEEARHYGSFERCNARLARYLAEGEGAGGDHAEPARISPIESIGHHVANGVTEEFRCSSGTLTRRAWRSGGGTGEGHGESH